MKKIMIILMFSFISLFGFEELTMQNFDSKIKDKNVIVDFYAPWCPPCRIIAKSLEDFDVIKPENVDVYKVNIDNEMVLAEKYGVTRLPTLLFFKDGKLVEEKIGVLSSEQLLYESKKNFE